MTKKWDLETSNTETELKIGIYTKNWAKQVQLKIFYYGQSQRSTGKVNSHSQRSTDDVCWRGSVTSPRADVAGREVQQAHVAREWAWTGAWGAWQVPTARGAHAREAETSASEWRRVWCSFWPFLVGFCSRLAILSFYACSLAVECTERWYPSIASTVAVTAVARFWQWRLDEGKGSGRTPEMSTGTRKPEEWLWYHVNSIKWERKTK